MSLNLSLYINLPNGEEEYLDVLYQTPTDLTIKVLNESSFDSQLELYFEWIKNHVSEYNSVAANEHIKNLKDIVKQYKGKIYFSVI